MSRPSPSPREGSTRTKIAGSLCVLLTILLIGCEPSLDHEDWRVRQRAVLKLTDQALLARIAKEDDVDWVRASAVSTLRDQALLADVAAYARDDYVRRRAVEKLTDQAVLARLVEELYFVVSENLMDRITDETTLARIALESQGDQVRERAVERLTEQSVLVRPAPLLPIRLLAQIALEDESPSVRAAAVKKLTDQTLLTKIATEDEDWRVRIAAVRRLTDQAPLTKIATEDEDWRVRQAAVPRLTDQTPLVQLWEDEGERWSIRRAAVENLKDLGVDIPREARLQAPTTIPQVCPRDGGRYSFSLAFQEVNGFTGFDLRTVNPRMGNLVLDLVQTVRVEPGDQEALVLGWPRGFSSGGLFRVGLRGEDDLGNPIRFERRVRLLARDHADCMR